MKYFFAISGFWLLTILPYISATLPAGIPTSVPTEVPATVPVAVPAEWPYYAEVRKYEQCKDLPKTKILFKSLQINRMAKDNYTISGDVDVTEDVPGPLYMGAIVQKCKEKPDVCLHVMDQVFQDLCEDLKDKKSKGYQVMHDYLNFKNPKCPLKKGTHRIVSQQFDGKKFAMTGGAAKYWNFHFYFYNDKKKTSASSCIYFEIAIKQKDQRQKQRNLGTKDNKKDPWNQDGIEGTPI